MARTADPTAYSLIEDPSGDLLMLKCAAELIHIREHPAYAKSPPGFGALRAMVLERSRAFGE